MYTISESPLCMNANYATVLDLEDKKSRPWPWSWTFCTRTYPWFEAYTIQISLSAETAWWMWMRSTESRELIFPLSSLVRCPGFFSSSDVQGYCG